jgi:hypothetical protein
VLKMPAWYSWNDLLHHWNKKDFELLEYLNQGLQPYSKYGQPVYCTQFYLAKRCHSWTHINRQVQKREQAFHLDQDIE